jgi:hypothetical protein
VATARKAMISSMVNMHEAFAVPYGFAVTREASR